MISIRCHPDFFLALFTKGHVTPMVRAGLGGLPAGCVFLDCHFDARRGLILLDFADGRSEQTETDIQFETQVPVPR